MTEDEFFSKVFGMDVELICAKDGEVGDVCLESKWVVGGMEGGHWKEECDHLSPVMPEPEPPFGALEKVILKFCPKILHTQYKEIESLITIRNFEEREWYGNRTEFRSKSIKLKDVYSKLKEYNPEWNTKNSCLK